MSTASNNRNIRRNSTLRKEQGTNPKVEGTNQDKGATTTPANDTGNTADQGVQPQELKPIELNQGQVKKLFNWMSDEANEKRTMEEQDDFIKTTLTPEQKVDFDAGAEIDYENFKKLLPSEAQLSEGDDKEIDKAFEKKGDAKPFPLTTEQITYINDNKLKSDLFENMPKHIAKITKNPYSEAGEETTVLDLMTQGYMPSEDGIENPTVEEANSADITDKVREDIKIFHEMKDKDLTSVSGQLGVAKNMLVSSVTDIFNFSPAQFTGAGLVAGVAGFFGRKYLGVWGVLKATFMATSTIGTLLWNKLTGVKHAVYNAKSWFKAQANTRRSNMKVRAKAKRKAARQKVKEKIKLQNAVAVEKAKGKARELKSKAKKVGISVATTTASGINVYAITQSARLSMISKILTDAGTDPDKIKDLTAQIKAVGTKNGITSKFPQDYRDLLGKDGKNKWLLRKITKIENSPDASKWFNRKVLAFATRKAANATAKGVAVTTSLAYPPVSALIATASGIWTLIEVTTFASDIKKMADEAWEQAKNSEFTEKFNNGKNLDILSRRELASGASDKALIASMGIDARLGKVDSVQQVFDINQDHEKLHLDGSDIDYEYIKKYGTTVQLDAILRSIELDESQINKLTIINQEFQVKEVALEIVNYQKTHPDVDSSDVMGKLDEALIKAISVQEAEIKTLNDKAIKLNNLIANNRKKGRGRTPKTIIIDIALDKKLKSDLEKNEQEIAIFESMEEILTLRRNDLKRYKNTHTQIADKTTTKNTGIDATIVAATATTILGKNPQEKNSIIKQQEIEAQVKVSKEVQDASRKRTEQMLANPTKLQDMEFSYQEAVKIANDMMQNHRSLNKPAKKKSNQPGAYNAKKGTYREMTWDYKEGGYVSKLHENISKEQAMQIWESNNPHPTKTAYEKSASKRRSDILIFSYINFKKKGEKYPVQYAGLPPEADLQEKLIATAQVSTVGAIALAIAKPSEEKRIANAKANDDDRADDEYNRNDELETQEMLAESDLDTHMNETEEQFASLDKEYDNNEYNRNDELETQEMLAESDLDTQMNEAEEQFASLDVEHAEDAKLKYKYNNTEFSYQEAIEIANDEMRIHRKVNKPSSSKKANMPGSYNAKKGTYREMTWDWDGSQYIQKVHDNVKSIKEAKLIWRESNPHHAKPEYKSHANVKRRDILSASMVEKDGVKYAGLPPVSSIQLALNGKQKPSAKADLEDASNLATKAR